MTRENFEWRVTDQNYVDPIKEFNPGQTLDSGISSDAEYKDDMDQVIEILGIEDHSISEHSFEDNTLYIVDGSDNEVISDSVIAGSSEIVEALGPQEANTSILKDLKRKYSPFY